MVAARAGRPRFMATPAMVAALPICSGVYSNVTPFAVAWQDGEPNGLSIPRSAKTATATAATVPVASSALRTTRPRWERRAKAASVGVQDGVELDRGARPGDHLDPAAGGVAAQQHVRRAGQLARLDHQARVLAVHD